MGYVVMFSYTRLITAAFSERLQYWVFRDPGFPLFEARHSGFGIREIQARLGIENIKGGGMPKITIGITGLYKILGGDYGIELPLSSGTAYNGFLCYVYFSYLPFYTRD